MRDKGIALYVASWLAVMTLLMGGLATLFMGVMYAMANIMFLY